MSVRRCGYSWHGVLRAPRAHPRRERVRPAPLTRLAGVAAVFGGAIVTSSPSSQSRGRGAPVPARAGQRAAGCARAESARAWEHSVGALTSAYEQALVRSTA